MGDRRLGLAAAAAILALGSWLRFAHGGGPYTQPDEPIAPWVVSRVLTSHELDTNWAHTPIQGDFGGAQYNFSSYYLTLSLLERIRETARPRAAAEGIEARIVFFRACSAGFGAAALALAMLVAYRIQGWGLALASGLWIAVNPLLVQDGHYARPEAFLTAAVLALVWMCRPRVSTPGWQPLLAGLTFGFLVACKVTLLLWSWLPLMACFSDWREWTLCPRGARLARLGLAAAGAAGGFLAGVPRAAVDIGGYLTGLNFLSTRYTHPFLHVSHYPAAMVFDFLGRYLVETVGWGAACLFAAGLVDSIARRQWRLVMAIFLPVLALAVFMGAHVVFYERNFSHAMPLYLLGAGLGLAALARLRALRPWSRPLVAVVAAAAALTPAAITERMVFSGFSGRFERMRAAELAGFLAPPRFPAVDRDHLIAAASDDDPWFRRKWEDHPRPYVVVWSDVDPEYTRQCLGRLRERFRFEERAVLPGLFDDLRGPNSLRDYLGRTLRGYVFFGPREPQPGP